MIGSNPSSRSFAWTRSMLPSLASPPSVACATLDASTSTRRVPLSSSSTSFPRRSSSSSGRCSLACVVMAWIVCPRGDSLPSFDDRRALFPCAGGIALRDAVGPRLRERRLQRFRLVDVLLQDRYGPLDGLLRLGAPSGGERARRILERRFV